MYVKKNVQVLVVCKSVITKGFTGLKFNLNLTLRISQMDFTITLAHDYTYEWINAYGKKLLLIVKLQNFLGSVYTTSGLWIRISKWLHKSIYTVYT